MSNIYSQLTEQLINLAHDLAKETNHFPIETKLTEAQAYLIKGLLLGYSMRARSILKLIERKVPCGECHLKPGETCNICGAEQPNEKIGT